MDNLHRVMRAISRERKSRRDHLNVFREFLNHLDTIGRRGRKPSPAPRNKASAVTRKVKRKRKG